MSLTLVAIPEALFVMSLTLVVMSFDALVVMSLKRSLRNARGVVSDVADISSDPEALVMRFVAMPDALVAMPDALVVMSLIPEAFVAIPDVCRNALRR